MQTQILLFIVVLFSFFTTIKAQPLTQTEIDSLKVVYDNNNLPDTTRLQAIKKISDGYYFTNPDSSFYFARLR